MIDFSKNYFELFELPVAYDVDLEVLGQHYRDMQRVMHPDRFANATDQERRLSMQGAALINEAYQTLKNPMLRAKYQLSLLGVEMDSQAQGSTQDMAFLMEQMELRERLERARSDDDPYTVIDDLKRTIKHQLSLLYTEFADKIAALEGDGLALVTDLVRKMQFMQKLHADAENLEAELDETY